MPFRISSRALHVPRRIESSGAFGSPLDVAWKQIHPHVRNPAFIQLSSNPQCEAGNLSILLMATRISSELKRWRERIVPGEGIRPNAGR